MKALAETSRLWRNSYYAVIMIGLLLSVFLLYTGLGAYSDSYDSGVYLESARMMARGFAAYRQVFDSQPPLWLPLIDVAFRLFGETFLAGQLVTATAGLITIVAVTLMAKQSGGIASSIIAGALVILSPLELQWSRTVNADVPSVALAAVGIALGAEYARNGRRAKLVAASAAAMCSILVKLSGAYTIPSLVSFAIVRWTHVENVDQRQRLRFITQDMLIIFGVFAVVASISLSLWGSEQAWNQVIRFHLAARGIHGSVPLDERWHTLARLMAGERLLAVAAPLAGLCVLSGMDGVALLAWPGFTFFGLLNHSPLYDHHMIALIPALAAAIGVGAGHFRRLYAVFVRWLARQTRSVRIMCQTAGVGVILVILGAGVRQAWIEIAAERAFIRAAALPSPDLPIAQLVIKHSRPGQMIITDAQGIAFFTGRNVPPNLTDTSFTRIATEYLRPRDVISQAEQYNVRLMLLWTGRLGSMPDVVRWAEKRFAHRIELGNGRALYTME